ncbi:hypothetical protein [Vibrio phage RYC]|nr:hypothetical protein [Vibrio phage RYC]
MRKEKTTYLEIGMQEALRSYLDGRDVYFKNLNTYVRYQNLDLLVGDCLTTPLYTKRVEVVWDTELVDHRVYRCTTERGQEMCLIYFDNLMWSFRYDNKYAGNHTLSRFKSIEPV